MGTYSSGEMPVLGFKKAMSGLVGPGDTIMSSSALIVLDLLEQAVDGSYSEAEDILVGDSHHPFQVQK